jgi:hypothetical protein
MAVMSLRGIAKLLDMDHAALVRMVTNGFPKTLKPFVDNELGMVTNSVKVIAKNSPYQGRSIVVFNTETIETLISAYALSLAKRKLRQNQMHIGERCIVLLKALVRTVLESAIKQACGLNPNIQKIAQKTYTDVVKLLKDFNFTIRPMTSKANPLKNLLTFNRSSCIMISLT